MDHLFRNGNYHEQNPVLGVRWAGFVSDTLTLASHGWKIAMNQDVRAHHMNGKVEIFMHHDRGGLNARGYMPVSAFEHIRRDSFHGTFNKPYFEITQVIADDGYVVMTEPIDFENFTMVETRPTMVRSQISQLPLFQKLFSEIPEVQELIIEPESVQYHLDKILAMQGPERKAIRQRDSRREPEQRQVHCQIISLHAA